MKYFTHSISRLSFIFVLALTLPAMNATFAMGVLFAETPTRNPLNTEPDNRQSNTASPDAKAVEKTASTPLDGVKPPNHKLLRGRVVDEAGTPVIGAVVAVPAGDTILQAKTDRGGRWTIKVPQQPDITVMAADAHRYGETPANGASSATGPTLSVVLKQVTPQGSDLARARTLLRESVIGTVNYNHLRHSAPRLLAPYDWGSAWQLLKDVNKDSGWTTAPADVLWLLETRKNLPLSLAPDQLKVLVDALPVKGDSEHIYMAHRFFPFAAAWSQKVYAAGLASLTPASTEPTKDVIFTRVLLAALARRLKQPGADELIDDASELALERIKLLRTKQLEELLFVDMVNEITSDPVLVERLLAKVPEEQWAATMSRVITKWAKDDLPAAQKMLDRMHARGQTMGYSRYREDFTLYFGLATIAVVRHLSRYDSLGSLALARRVTSLTSRAAALAMAARDLPRVQASLVFHEAFSGPAHEWDNNLRPWIAALASRSDRKLGSVLFDQLGLPVQPWPDSGNAELAFFLAPSRPGHARLILESSWALARTLSTPIRLNFDQVSVAIAMASVDVARSLEMARALGVPQPQPQPHSGDEHDRWRAQMKIAHYLLAPEEIRQFISFSRWCRDELIDGDG
jgi:hypothetical protein